jgi:hypothetical protein
MKKIMMLFLIILVTGCTSLKDSDYYYYYDMLIANEVSSTDYKYDIDIVTDSLNDEEIMYQVIIDNPKEEINDLQVVVMHNITTEDIFPSYGFYGDDMDNSVPFKGINLLGYIQKKLIDKDIVFKVLVKYNDVTNYHIIEIEE